VPGEEIFEDVRNKTVAHCKQCTLRLQQPQPGKKRKLPLTWPSKTGKKRKSSDSSEDEDDDIPQPGVMKPDITFFGEALPTRFFDHFGGRDQDAVDLIIVIGTSLMVAPVSEIPLHVPPACPQIFISREVSPPTISYAVARVDTI